MHKCTNERSVQFRTTVAHLHRRRRASTATHGGALCFLGLEDLGGGRGHDARHVYGHGFVQEDRPPLHLLALLKGNNPDQL